MIRFQQLPAEVRPVAREAFSAVWHALGQPGPCWTGAQRTAMAAISRDAEHRPPWFETPDLASLDAESPGSDGLSPFAAEVVHRVAVDAASIDRATAELIIATIGAPAYAELGAVIAQVVPIDHFCAVLGVAPEPFDQPKSGDPTGERWDDVMDIGSYLPSTADWAGPNVGRAFSLSRTDDLRRLRLVRAMYSSDEFDQLVWTSRYLTRPQIELLAARTSALNECFY